MQRGEQRIDKFMRDKQLQQPEISPVDPAAVMQFGSGAKRLVTGEGEGGRVRAASDVIRGALGVAGSTPVMAAAAPPLKALASGLAVGGSGAVRNRKRPRSRRSSTGVVRFSIRRSRHRSGCAYWDKS